jgi:hypothetical protein
VLGGERKGNEKERERQTREKTAKREKEWLIEKS